MKQLSRLAEDLMHDGAEASLLEIRHVIILQSVSLFAGYVTSNASEF